MPGTYRVRALSQARAGATCWRETWHLLGSVVLDVLKAEKTVGDHTLSTHTHAQVPLGSGVLRVAKSYRFIGEVSAEDIRQVAN